ncbi:hypothetical protein CXB51_004699 [Gossypium anomalum]|uniref:Integrase catalytic domain-containing protein n=1 Tax=Gossypium anomalum TaxID=47600 RepID=A0A8J6DAX6_9ROSI|nr:hypothetical protein CXB51_004699 [Gossypium anomalum]
MDPISSPSAVHSATSRMASNLNEGVVDDRFFATKKLSILLDDSNYLLWRQQVLLAVKTYKLQMFLNVRSTPPPRLFQYEQQDSALASWLLSSVSPAVLPHLIGLETSAQIWNAIVSLYGNKTTSRLMFYRRARHSQRKGDLSMRDFLLKVKFYYNNLAKCGEIISEHEHVTAILNGLPLEYESVISIIVASQLAYNVQSVTTMLVDAEARQQVIMADVPSSVNLCQLCGKTGHLVDRCCHRFDTSYKSTSYKQPPQANMCMYGPERASTPTPPAAQPNAFLATAETVAGNAWYPDSGATHHLTHSVGSLGDSTSCNEPSIVYVGNGNALPIICFGQSSLLTRTRPLYMKSLLFAPGITKNLLFVSKFTRDNQVMFEFLPTQCKVRDLRTKEVLLQGSVHQGLYKLHLKDNVKDGQVVGTSHCCTASVSIPLSVWHSRLGHPCKNTLLKALSHCNVSFDTNKESFSYVACHLGKEHKLPFFMSETKYSAHLQLVIADVWGPAPITSNGFRFYVAFTDTYTRYTWVYFLRKKSEVLIVFLNFHRQAERFLGLQLRAIQTDGGGEFQVLRQYLTQHGILQRLPSIPLGFVSPYKKFFQTKPSYSFLRTFVYLFFPYLRPYNNNKLQFRSTPCTFLGYSSVHKGYRCLASNSRIYTSRHVTFHETDFPFKTVNTKLASPVSQPHTSSKLNVFISTQNHHQPSNVLLPTRPSSVSHPLPVTSLSTSPIPDNSPTFSNSLMSQSSPLNSSVPLPSSSNIPRNIHAMITHSKAGIFKPKAYLSTTSCSPPDTPTNIHAAMAHQCWKDVVQAELQALVRNNTWTFCPLPDHRRTVGCKWLFKPPGFEVPGAAGQKLVCKLNKALYGLRQAPHAWFHTLKHFLIDKLGFSASKADPSLFLRTSSDSQVFLMAYVDDIVLTGSSNAEIYSVVQQFHDRFALKYMGRLNFFITIEVKYTSQGLLLSQRKYVQELLNKRA